MSAYDYTKPDADTPFGLAYRMAGYVKDLPYIVRYVAQEYGRDRAPTLKQVEAMQRRHQSARDRMKRTVENRERDRKLAYRGEQEAA